MRKNIFVFLFLLGRLPSMAQVTAVHDTPHNQTSQIEAYSAATATSLKQLFELPFLEKISKVQTFFKQAAQLISAVVTNLRMTRQLIQTEKEIYELFTHSIAQIDEAQNFPDKWKYRWILLQLFNQSTQIFEVFDLATQQNKGIIDDKGRIELIKRALQQAKAIKAAFKATVRRTNRAWYQYKIKQRQLKIFNTFFKTMNDE